MYYPFITFVGTAHNEKTLVLTFQTKEDAYIEYRLLDNHNFCWYKNNKDEIVISLKRTDGSIMNIRLISPIQEYANNNWLLNHELSHITTDFEGSDIEDKILPTALNRQIPCP